MLINNISITGNHLKIKVKGIENQGSRGKMDINERSMIVLKSIIENYIQNIDYGPEIFDFF